jgi:hypothetical protein
MRKIFITISALSLVFSTSCFADTLASTAAARELTDKVMLLVSKGDLGAAIRQLKPYSVVPDAEIEATIGQMNLQVPLIRERFGQTLGSEFIKEDRIGDSFIRFTQLQKLEKHAVRWTFVFYRGSEGWLLNTFNYDDNIRSLFPN